MHEVSEFSLKVYCCYWAKLSCSLLRGNFVFTCTESRRWNCIKVSQSFIIVLKAFSGHLWCIYMWLTCILWCYILLLQPLIKRNELIMPFTMCGHLCASFCGVHVHAGALILVGRRTSYVRYYLNANEGSLTLLKCVNKSFPLLTYRWRIKNISISRLVIFILYLQQHCYQVNMATVVYYLLIEWFFPTVNLDMKMFSYL